MNARILASCLALLCLLVGGPAWAAPADGFYAVVRRETPPGEAPCGEGEIRLPYEDGAVVLKGGDFVPLVLKAPPTKRPDPTERTQSWVEVTLTEEAAARFETFTREHLGQSVAVLVNGNVVSVHGIRAVITGGQVQISRCGDDRCEVLFRELTR